MTKPLPPALTPARILDRAMSRHEHLFLVRCRFHLPHSRKWAEEYEVIETTELSTAVDKLLGLDGPKAVIEIDLRAGTSRDVSEAAAHQVAQRIRNGDADLTRDRVEFCQEHLGVGVLPAVA